MYCKIFLESDILFETIVTDNVRMNTQIETILYHFLPDKQCRNVVLHYPKFYIEYNVQLFEWNWYIFVLMAFGTLDTMPYAGPSALRTICCSN